MSEPAAVFKDSASRSVPKAARSSIPRRLTILNVVMAPRLYIVPPHDHHMWAVIAFMRAVRTTSSGGAFGASRTGSMPAPGPCARAITVPLGTDIIHSVINPIDRLSGAIHIYGGDFFCHRTEQMGFVDA